MAFALTSDQLDPFAGEKMQARVITSSMRPKVALAEYDFLPATYDVLCAPRYAIMLRWMQRMRGSGQRTFWRASLTS